MAKKYEFQPDKPYSTWLNHLQLTRQQQKQALKWSLFGLMLLLISVVQDVMLCRIRILGGTTDLVPCAIIMITILAGSQKGAVFALIASLLFFLSGSAPGPHVLVLITVLAIFAAALRQNYLHPTFPAMLLCTALALSLYELSIYGLCLILGQVTPERIGGFLMGVLLSLPAAAAMYPIFKAIGRIGGDTWKE